MARKIAFINYKGGVGKTSLIVNTAAALVKAGKRVLVCDFDTQSNASIWLLKLDRWNKINASGEGEVYSIFEPGKAQVKDLIIRDAIEGKSGECPMPGLDLLPTAFNLVDLENEYNGDPKRSPFLVFRNSWRWWSRTTISSCLIARRTFSGLPSAASLPRTKFACRPTRTPSA